MLAFHFREKCDRPSLRWRNSKKLYRSSLFSAFCLERLYLDLISGNICRFQNIGTFRLCVILPQIFSEVHISAYKHTTISSVTPVTSLFVYYAPTNAEQLQVVVRRPRENPYCRAQNIKWTNTRSRRTHMNVQQNERLVTLQDSFKVAGAI
jgi:hypothetical protein